MLSGKRPFTGASTATVIDAILHRVPPGLREIDPGTPVELVHIVGKALEKDRELRYQGMREMRADLARVKRDGASSGAIAVATPKRRRRWVVGVAAIIAVIVAGAAYFFTTQRRVVDSATAPIRALTRITFDDGLQGQPAWSPDGRFIAYVSNHGGNVDIWVQPLAGGRAVRVTSNPANDWQPDWSPDGNNIVFRSEREGGGIFMVPALGGAERKLADFGYTPQWRPDGSSVLVVRKVPFFTGGGSLFQQAYLLAPDGSAPKRILETELSQFSGVAGMMWHPDGQRVTFFGRRLGGPPVVQIWTVLAAGGTVVQSEGPPEFDKQTDGLILGEMRWAPKGDALLLQARSRGVSNLWRVPVDPATLRYTSLPVRLTTGSGQDGELAVSPDGQRVAFVTSEEVARLWSIPFDSATRRELGGATPLTPPNTAASSFDLSADGMSLVYVGVRPGANDMQLWTAPIGGAPRLLREASLFSQPRLSRSGDRVVYGIRREAGKPISYAWLDVSRGDEHAASTGPPHDWSPDGRVVIGGCGPPPPNAICTTKIDDPASPRVRLLSDPGHHLWQGRYSPDGRWVLFNAQDIKESSVSILGVAPAGGGAWRRLTDPRLWADKARWAPDGKTIYFISNRESAFFDVWGLGFDPEKGTTVGEEFRVTRFTDPGRRVLSSSASELGVSRDRIVLPILERSGSVWVLDQIDR
jgi:Tol biopolymer transport system component